MRVLVVLAIGGLNLALGYVLGTVVARHLGRLPVQLAAPTVTTEATFGEAAATVACEPVPKPPVEDRDPVGSPTPDTPNPAPLKTADWLDTLDESSKSNGFVQAVTTLCEADIEAYCARLASIEQHIGSQPRLDGDTAQVFSRELLTLNETWMSKQSVAADLLFEHRDDLGDFQDAAEKLDALLLDHAAQSETTGSNIGMFDFKNNPQSGQKRLLSEVRRVSLCANLLRDNVAEAGEAVRLTSRAQ